MSPAAVFLNALVGVHVVISTVRCRQGRKRSSPVSVWPSSGRDDGFSSGPHSPQNPWRGALIVCGERSGGIVQWAGYTAPMLIANRISPVTATCDRSHSCYETNNTTRFEFNSLQYYFTKPLLAILATYLQLQSRSGRFQVVYGLLYACSSSPWWLEFFVLLGQGKPKAEQNGWTGLVGLLGSMSSRGKIPLIPLRRHFWPRLKLCPVCRQFSSCLSLLFHYTGTIDLSILVCTREDLFLPSLHQAFTNEHP